MSQGTDLNLLTSDRLAFTYFLLLVGERGPANLLQIIDLQDLDHNVLCFIPFCKKDSSYLIRS